MIPTPSARKNVISCLHPKPYSSLSSLFSAPSKHLKQNQEQQSQEIDHNHLSSEIAGIVLSHTGTPKSLSGALISHPSKPIFNSILVDRVLKLLWNDGPRALLFFNSLLHHHPSYSPAPSSFDHAIDIAARLRDRGAVSSLMSTRQKRRIPPSPRTFAVIMERYVNSGKADRAIRVFLSMHQHGCRQDLSSFNTLLDVLCKSGRVEKACSLFSILRRRFGTDTITYNVIADGWCRIKQTPRAIATLKEMVESGIDPTVTTYNILLKGFFRSGQVKEAMEFFRQMKRRCKQEGISDCGPDVVSYTTVVHGLGVVGQVDKARKMFDEMRKKGCNPSVATYNAMIQVLCKKDSVKNAILVFEEMIGNGCVPNTLTYNLIVRGLCHAGDMNTAIKFVDRMRRDGLNPNVQTYNVLIRYWTEAGEIENGLGLLKEMLEGGNCLPNMDTYNVLISSMFVRKKPEDMITAGNLVMEMVERGHVPRRFMFNRVLNGLFLTGNQEFARELLRIQSSFRRLRKEVKL